MRKMILYMLLISLLLIASCGYSESSTQDSTLNATLTKNNGESTIKEKKASFEEKIDFLQNEMSKYRTDLSPTDTYNICKTAGDLVEGILSEKSSIDAKPIDIIGFSQDYYINYGDVIKISDKSYRIIEFGLKEIKMGGITSLYLQKWDTKGKLVTQKIHELNITDSVNKIILSSITKLENNQFIIIAEELYDTETAYINFIILRNEEDKWVKYGGINSAEKDGWILEPYEGGFSIENEIVEDVSRYDYSLCFYDEKITVNVIEKNNNSVLKKFEIVYTDGIWKIM